MTTFPNSPRLLKGGIVLLDPDSSVVVRTMTLQLSALQYTVDLVLCGFSSAKVTTVKGSKR